MQYKFQFHNPYNFARTPKRELKHAFAGDYDPAKNEAKEDHSRYWPELYTGTIPVRLRVRTPLFITDPNSKDPKGKKEDESIHYTYDCLDHIPATALKGMLSSAYEIITNSRYRVFNKKQHEKKLEYRDGFKRQTYKASPWECLDDSLRPAEEREKMSPADRLLGWVPQEGKGESKGKDAWKGKIRISDGIFYSKNPEEKAVTRFETSVPLSILGAPKPSQARFYLGNENGDPQQDGIRKEAAGYVNTKKLRGRKIYLHHTLWNQQVTEAGVPEYRQLKNKDERTNQNRSITGWIEAKRDFYFKIKVENLTAEELGAILTLLNMRNPADNFRLGYGKPLGLGSVALSIATPDKASFANDPLPIAKGSERGQYYRDLCDTIPPGLLPLEREQLIQAYKKAMAEAYVKPFKDAPALKRSLWKEHPFAEYFKALDEEQEAMFECLWREALERGDSEISPDDPFFKEVLELFAHDYPELPEVLAEYYSKELTGLKEQYQYDFGWRKLPFIEDLLLSMEGFKEEPVHYPRNSKERGEEGFKWFVANEKNKRLALPLVGKHLQSAIKER